MSQREKATDYQKSHALLQAAACVRLHAIVPRQTLEAAGRKADALKSYRDLITDESALESHRRAAREAAATLGVRQLKCRRVIHPMTWSPDMNSTFKRDRH